MSKRGNAVTCEGNAYETSVSQTQWDIDSGGCCMGKAKSVYCNDIPIHLVIVIDS